jgi:hypothetical protein
MWWDSQNLDKPLVGLDGTRWFFRIWHGTVDALAFQTRIGRYIRQAAWCGGPSFPGTES